MINVRDYSKRIIICIPNTWPTVYSKFVESLNYITAWNNINDLMENYDTVVLETVWGKWFPIDANRDELVAFALNNPDCTHVLFFDADSVLPSNIIQMLVKIDTGDISAGLQFHKVLPHAPIPLIAMPGQGDDPYSYQAINIMGKTEPIECDAVGMGATLIPRHIFERIPRPWFEYQMSRDTPRRDVSEDMAFCQRARRLGYKIWVDPTAIVGHLRVESVGYPHYQAGQNLMMERLDNYDKASDILTLGGLLDE